MISSSSLTYSSALITRPVPPKCCSSPTPTGSTPTCTATARHVSVLPSMSRTPCAHLLRATSAYVACFSPDEAQSLAIPCFCLHVDRSQLIKWNINTRSFLESEVGASGLASQGLTWSLLKQVCLSLLNTWDGRRTEQWDPTTSSILQVCPIFKYKTFFQGADSP